MQIHGFQTDIAWEDPGENFARIASMVEAALPDGGNIGSEGREGILVFPEMATTGFTMRSETHTPESEAAACDFFGGLARERGAWVVAGIGAIDATNGRAANEALCFDPSGAVAARYRKQRPFTPAGESQHYLRGDSPVVFALGPWKVALLICYDLRFPEPFRSAVALGADLFIVVANWPAARVAHWTTLLRARAIENQACVLGVNRCGADPNLPYPGASLLVDCQGRTLGELDDAPGVLSAELDHGSVAAWRRDFPALRDAGLA